MIDPQIFRPMTCGCPTLQAPLCDPRLIARVKALVPDLI